MRAKTGRLRLACHAQADRAAERAAAVPRHLEGRALEAVGVGAVAEGEGGACRRRREQDTGAEGGRDDPGPPHQRGSTGEVT